MRALILLLLVAVVQKSLCGSEDINTTIADLFTEPTPDGSSTNGYSEEEVEDVAPCGVSRNHIFGPLRFQRYDALQYPWMVALFRRQLDRCTLQSMGCWKYSFTGTLINMNVVLTTAHNVLGIEANRLKTRAGDWDREATTELYPYQERLVKTIIIHNQYRYIKPAIVEYDAALLVMETPYTESNNIATICLPQPDLVYSEDCKTAGWGRVRRSRNDVYNNTLRVVDMNLVNRTKCSGRLTRETQLGIRLHSSFLCARSHNKEDSCQGGVGSPLMCQDNPDYYYQRGIASWTLGCDKRDVSVAYTDVAKIRNWIDQQMLLNNFNSKSYIFVPE